MCEIQRAEITLVKLVQQMEFNSEIKDLSCKGMVNPQNLISSSFIFPPCIDPFLFPHSSAIDYLTTGSRGFVDITTKNQQVSENLQHNISRKKVLPLFLASNGSQEAYFGFVNSLVDATVVGRHRQLHSPIGWCTGWPKCEITSMNIFLTDALDEPWCTTCHSPNGHPPGT
ncbi:hypothetical protein TNCV_853751 [Trichonephila clavipes]|nr:hypothetical protein TNCV_853751 [Trichonephila clavipes]